MKQMNAKQRANGRKNDLIGVEMHRIHLLIDRLQLSLDDHACFGGDIDVDKTVETIDKLQTELDNKRNQLSYSAI